MALQHITDGERRGLILLILLLVAVTLLLTWRDRTSSCGPAGLAGSSDTTVTVADTAVVSVYGASVIDTAARHGREPKAATRVRKGVTRNLPERSPRDERVD